MISLDTSTKTKTPLAALLVGAKDEKGSVFADLLKSAKIEAKTLKDGALVLAIGEKKIIPQTIAEIKSQKIVTDLPTRELKEFKEIKKEELELLSHKLTSVVENRDLKELIHSAKEYLRERITQSDGYKTAQIKELPNSIESLLNIASSLELDLSSVTLEEVINSAQKKVEKQPKIAHQLSQGVKSEVAGEQIAKNAQTPLQTLLGAMSVEQKELPVFQLLQAAKAPSTTEQFVTIKQQTTTAKSEQPKTTDALKILLSGEKAAAASLSELVVPVAAAQEQMSLDETDMSISSKGVADGAKIEPEAKATASVALKSDSLEVKINEAKQMIKYLSDDIKTAIDNYKAPFTRIKVQLNPSHLGEVDLTVVQRGKELVVNLSSNSVAINTLMTNAIELKTQLQNSGINSATLNFSNSQNSSAEHQQQKRSQREAEYAFAQNEESHEEIMSALEIVIPRYI